jgi:arabinogalactan oligomer / maltooligosaccharide transport system permease protein
MTGEFEQSSGTTVLEPHEKGRGANAPRPSPSYGAGFFVKWFLVVAFNGLVLAFIPRMIEQQSWIMLGVAVAVLVAVDLIYTFRKRIPGKYLLPGMVFLIIFGVFPVIYTIFISFTNYGTGNLLNQNQAIEQIERNSLQAATEASARYRVFVADGDDGLYLILEQEAGADAGSVFIGTTGEEGSLEPADEALIERTGPRITAYDGDRTLNLAQMQDRQAEVLALSVPTDDGAIVMESFTRAAEKTQRLQYEDGVMVDQIDGTVYEPIEGTFTATDGSGRTLSPGFTVGVGFDNYNELFTNPRFRDPFVRVFIWTFAFSAFTVFFTFALGLLLAMIFNDERMRFRRVYRVLMVIPYALPAFMTILVWRGMLNPTFGIINELLPSALEQNWLNDGTWARVSMVLVNTWLGFSYMFLVSTGALTGIPSDLKEAAFVDGANGFQAFRKVTLPLLLVAVAPVLISSFAFNFNNYTLVRLLTNGGPTAPGSPAGDTDILISYTSKVAFGGAGADYGLATAISTIIFILVALITSFSFRFTKVMEEVR